MPLDAVCISLLAKELTDKLIGAKVDRIQQPQRDMLILTLRTRGESLRLLISGGNGSARVHFTRGKFENPSEPPMFCMLLRKHLSGGRIVSVSQPACERMIIIELCCRDEMGYDADRKLMIEMIGSSSNVILVGADGRIIDCMHRMEYGGDALRRMLPGSFYRMPPRQNKTPLLETTPEERRAILSGADMSLSPDKLVMNCFSGVSPLICRELAYRCGGDSGLLPEALDAFCDTVNAGDIKPVMLMENGSPRDFSFMDIHQYGTAVECVDHPDCSSMLDAYYTQRDRAEMQRRRGHELEKTVRTLRDRQERKLAGQAEELLRTERRDEVRKKAELLTANMYRVKKGDRVLRCEDYYSDGCPETEIELDPLKTPQQNAASMYREYNKLKAAREHLTVLISQGEEQLDYLNRVLTLIRQAETEKDLAELRRELTETGIIRKSRGGKADRSRAQTPIRYVSDEGFEILVGRSNIQNDELTTKLARRTDIWLHTQKIHGSHVVIRCDGLTPGEETVAQAASIAVYHSQGREGGKIPVDYTMVKFVRKPPGALPGKVIYTDYRTVLAESDGELIERLAAGAK